MIINNSAVSIAADPAPGTPSFRNTLSAGDRNTLALAFFFASLDQEPGLGEKIVIIDDPISSLDEHRALSTVQEIRRFAQRANQVVVLSHNRSFLAHLWEGTDPTVRAAVEVVREGAGSTLRAWDVTQEAITEHDRRDARLSEFLTTGAGDLREVARDIRPHLEAYLRVAHPQWFPPGTLLGSFRNVSEQRIGTTSQVLDRQSTDELNATVEYANRFHHDTNPAWQTEHINDAELRAFVQRALSFVKR